MAGELGRSEGEPAMNLYEAPGLFGAHKDHMALTVLVPLTALRLAGGGTGFWGPPHHQPADGSNPDGDAVIVTPAAGDALVFGACNDARRHAHHGGPAVRARGVLPRRGRRTRPRTGRACFQRRGRAGRGRPGADPRR